MRISDWSSDVCFSDLLRAGDGAAVPALAVVPDQDGLAQRNAAGFFAQVRASVCLVRACLGLVGRGEQPLAARFLLRFVGVGGLHVRFPFWLGKHICRCLYSLQVLFTIADERSAPAGRSGRGTRLRWFRDRKSPRM